MVWGRPFKYCLVVGTAVARLLLQPVVPLFAVKVAVGVPPVMRAEPLPDGFASFRVRPPPLPVVPFAVVVVVAVRVLPLGVRLQLRPVMRPSEIVRVPTNQYQFFVRLLH